MIETPYNSVNDDRLQLMLRWLQANEIDFDKLTVASTDAGFRRYFRLHKQNSSLIAVDAPPAYEDTAAFIDIAKRLVSSGLRPPHIVCYSLEKGFLVVEDFGDSHLQETLAKHKMDQTLATKVYRQAVSIIRQMQDETNCTGLPVCDKHFLRAELELFSEWYLQKHQGIKPDHKQRGLLDSTFTLLINSATEQPYRFMHRDFHCRNLMMPDNNDLGLIDFQGAMLGPVTYDPVSLLKDVYINWPTDFQHKLMEQHRTALSLAVDQRTYQRWFDLMGLQRHIKILGIFCRLHYRDSKSHYLRHLPTVINHIETTLADYPELSEFYAMFKSLHQDNR